MQLHYRTKLLGAIAALLLFASCSKSNKQGKMVPKDAGFVLEMDGKSLSQKINMQELKQSDWYKQVVTEFKSDSMQSDFMKKIQDNTLVSGVDSLSDFIFFGDNSSLDGMKLVVEGGLKDAKAFESYLKMVYPEGSVSKNGDISVVAIKDKAVITWNNEKFAFGLITPSMNGMNSMGKNYGMGDNKDSANSTKLITYCKNLYSLKDDSSLAKDEKFSDLMNTDGDIHAWVNIEKLMGASIPMGALSMMKMDAFTQGAISTYTASFDKGKITIKSKGYSGKELSELYKKYSGGSINTDMLKNIPSQNVVGVFAFHFKPEGLKELIKLTGLDGFANLFLSREGMTTDDFIKANKGDIMLSVSDLAMKKDSFSYTGSDGIMHTTYSENPDSKFIFSAAIDDKDAFNKLVNVVKGQAGKQDKVYYNSNANYFAIGNDENMISKYLAGAKNDQSFIGKISGNAIGVYVDIQKILKALEPQAAKDSVNKLVWDESVKVWDNITVTGGDYSGGGYNMMMEINLLDKNTNSLMQLFKYSVRMAELEKEKMKKAATDYNFSFPKNDSTASFNDVHTDSVMPKRN